jgi:glutamate 5-kinase
VEVRGGFSAGDVVEIADTTGVVLARGLVRVDERHAAAAAGKKSSELSDEVPVELVHRDDLIVY